MLRIRKEIKNQDGTITEVEGTEAEVEAYERKQEKKRQSETVKKERKLLLDSAKALGKMTKKDLLELIQKALADLQAKEIHHYHWYYNNGYWWKPYWDGIVWTYQATTHNPNLGQWYTSTIGVNSNQLNDGHVITCNSLDDLTRTTGIGAEAVYASMLSNTAAQPAVGVYNSSESSYVVQADDVTAKTVNGLKLSWNSQAEDLYKGTVSMTDAPVTSGIINMNIKS